MTSATQSEIERFACWVLHVHLSFLLPLFTSRSYSYCPRPPLTQSVDLPLVCFEVLPLFTLLMSATYSWQFAFKKKTNSTSHSFFANFSFMYIWFYFLLRFCSKVVLFVFLFRVLNAVGVLAWRDSDLTGTWTPGCFISFRLTGVISEIFNSREWLIR